MKKIKKNYFILAICLLLLFSFLAVSASTSNCVSSAKWKSYTLKGTLSTTWNIGKDYGTATSSVNGNTIKIRALVNAKKDGGIKAQSYKDAYTTISASVSYAADEFESIHNIQSNGSVVTSCKCDIKK